METAQSISIGMALVLGIAAMLLIYLVTLLLPKIAAAVDKALFGKNADEGVNNKGERAEDIRKDFAEPSPARVEDNFFKAADIYEGENSLDENEDNN